MNDAKAMTEQYEEMNRRQFLTRAGGQVAVVPLVTSAFGSIIKGAEPDDGPDDLDEYDFLLPRVKFTSIKREVDRWDVRPGGDSNLLRELSSAIRCRVKPIRQAYDWQPQWATPGQLNAVVEFDQPEELKKYPFLFMTGENNYNFDQVQKANLKEYILRGGFLLMDDCVVASGGDFFYKSSYAMLEEIFAAGSVKRIPPDHEIFHNVYDFGATGLPHIHGQNHGARGIFIGDRLAIFLSSTDLHCGWCDSRGGVFGRQKYKEAIEMGINIIMYAISH